jgi:uncharacterized protein YjbJ (UPF0337 family)
MRPVWPACKQLAVRGLHCHKVRRINGVTKQEDARMADKDRHDEGTENRVEGTAEEMEGKARKNIGDATDDRSQQLKGKGQELKGKAQKKFGEHQQDSDKPDR